MFLGKEDSWSKQHYWGPHEKRMKKMHISEDSNERNLPTRIYTDDRRQRWDTKHTLHGSVTPKEAKITSSQICMGWRIWNLSILLYGVDKKNQEKITITMASLEMAICMEYLDRMNTLCSIRRSLKGKCLLELKDRQFQSTSVRSEV